MPFGATSKARLKKGKKSSKKMPSKKSKKKGMKY